jgi:hypothetical protein
LVPGSEFQAADKRFQVQEPEEALAASTTFKLPEKQAIVDEEQPFLGQQPGGLDNFNGRNDQELLRRVEERAL